MESAYRLACPATKPWANVSCEHLGHGDTLLASALLSSISYCLASVSEAARPKPKPSDAHVTAAIVFVRSSAL